MLNNINLLRNNMTSYLSEEESIKTIVISEFTFDKTKVNIEPPYDDANFDLSELEKREITIETQWTEYLLYDSYHRLFMVIGDMYKQVRKHRKGRINKKWAKRYGYKLIEK